MATKVLSQTVRSGSPILAERIARQIFLIRGHKVMIDTDLAELYQVPTKRVNEQVRRNSGRFPADFMFQLTAKEAENLRSQFATSSWGGRRHLPCVFTEHGVAMLASVLNSERAVQMSVLIIRAFVKLREMLATHKELAARIAKVETIQRRQKSVITILAREILDLKQPKRRFGFNAE